MMSTFQVTVNERLAVITLDRGRSNPINHIMVKELRDCIHTLETDDSIGGLILTGKEGFFTSGVDLIEVYDYDQEQIKQFWVDFLRLQAELVAFNKPLVAAISGHSPAGGCLFAICCDYRVLVEGAYIIGLNEIPVGIIVPDFVFDLYAFWIGRHKAYQHLLEGKLFTVNEALNIGLVDEVCRPEDLSAIAEKKIRIYMQYNPVTWSQSKLNLRKELIEKLNADQTNNLNYLLEQWWAPAARQNLQLIIQNLRSKNGTK